MFESGSAEVVTLGDAEDENCLTLFKDVQSMFRPFVVNNLGGLFFINLISCDDPPSDLSKKNSTPKEKGNFS